MMNNKFLIQLICRKTRNVNTVGVLDLDSLFVLITENLGPGYGS